MRIPRAHMRGRPHRGHESADSKLLQYLVLLSMKYGIDPQKLFISFVEAWKREQSACKGLLIECRKRTRDSAVFLITCSRKVVAQFPIPNRILEETNPLKEYASAKTSSSTKLKRTKAKHLHIGDLKPGMNRVNLKARILQIPKPRQVITRFGGFATVTNASITDETGIIHLPLWNKQIDVVSVGDIIGVENARVVVFRGERQLRVSRGGQLSVLEKTGLSFEKLSHH
jgi:hypothetical protein